MNILNFLQTQEVAMADTFRDNGKIYVVVAVLAVIMLGILGYLFFLDNKLTKIEKELDTKK